MTLIEIILLSAALAMDAFAVSISIGVYSRDTARATALKCGSLFGIFQGGMLYIGYIAANFLSVYIEPFSHWVAFTLLMFIGGKMIYEAFTEEDSEPNTAWGAMIVLAIATSIDALAAGISIAVISTSFLLPVLLVGGITFALSYFGVILGATLSKNSPGKIFDIIGGVILIGLAIKSLVEHFY